MALNDIIDKIKDDSAATAEEIVAEARGQAEEKLAEARKRADEAAKERLLQAEREAETVRVRILALARLAARDSVLTRKQATVDRVFGRVTERLAALDDEAYSMFLEKLLVERAEGGVEVLPAAADARSVDAALLERATGALGEKARLALGARTDAIARGFILRSGRITIDCSIATLVAEAREEYEAQVYERLFGEEAGG